MLRRCRRTRSAPTLATAFAGADRIVVLDRGRIVAIGRHEELLATSAVYRGLAGEGLPAGSAAPPAAALEQGSAR